MAGSVSTSAVVVKGLGTRARRRVVVQAREAGCGPARWPCTPLGLGARVNFGCDGDEGERLKRRGVGRVWAGAGAPAEDAGGALPPLESEAAATRGAEEEGGEGEEEIPPPPPPAVAKGDFAKVDRAKYAASVESLANHPSNYTGLEYIFEGRGEVLEVRLFPTGWYCLVSWHGIPTAPAWLSGDLLNKVDANTYAYNQTEYTSPDALPLKRMGTSVEGAPLPEDIVYTLSNHPR